MTFPGFSLRLLPPVAVLLFVVVAALPRPAGAGIVICLNGPCCDGGVFRTSRFVCRPAAGGCDVAETCTGSSSACPSDAIRPARTSCRAATGACDRAEACNGSSKDCPADGVRTTTTVCRVAAGPCDVAETCDGIGKDCGPDFFAAPDLLCRTASGECDVEESCSGTSAACPGEAVKAGGTLCRKPLGECDVAELCDGTGKECPADDDRDGEPCPDDVACLETVGTCVGKTCVGVVEKVCDDGDPCTQNLCDALNDSTCIFPPDDDGIDCDDGDSCTADDECKDGICVGTPLKGCVVTTTTTLEEVVCGDADGDGKVEASDALAALKAAVGVGVCAFVRCDWNGDGSLTAPDALLILREAVGQPGSPNCPDSEPADAASPVAGSGSSTTTTTTMP